VSFAVRAAASVGKALLAGYRQCGSAKSVAQKQQRPIRRDRVMAGLLKRPLWAIGVSTDTVMRLARYFGGDARSACSGTGGW